MTDDESACNTAEKTSAQSVSLIAAVDSNYGLGKNNQLLCHLPADLQHFKALTLGKPIIMGRKTFASIGKPLPRRRNIILSRTAQTIPGVEVVTSLLQALSLTESDSEVMIIGGADVYQQALPYASRVYLTAIEHHFEADVFFPKLDLKEWHCVSQSYRPADEKNAYGMWFYDYQR
jgi:dihydrofolate reductase